MIRVFGIRRCDTMARAMTWLTDRHIEFQLHDYRKDGVPEDLLADWIARAGWASLVNTRGTTFRKLSPDQTADLDGVRAFTLLKAYPSAIRRPIVDRGNRLLIGFDADEWAEALT